jgi:glucan 1,3-beta-glucosidase
LTALQNLANRYAGATDVVTAIQLLNEPMGPNLDQGALKKFYYDGWGNIRNANGDTAVVIHDAFFDPISYWNGFMGPGSGVNNVMLDHHNYQIFSDGEVAMSPQQHVSAACSSGPNFRQCDKWLVIGEWTGAQTDCAKWLNGLGKGARYDGTFPGSNYHGSCDGKYTGSVAGLSGADKANLRQFVEAQLDAYEQRTGWFFWTWKTESAPEWHFQDLVRNGLIPQPLTSRQYPGQCGY